MDADSVWMEAADKGALNAFKSIFSLLPEFVARRLMPQRLVVLPHVSYLAYTQCRSSR